MKKYIAILLALSTIALAACSSSNEEELDTTESSVESEAHETETETTETNPDIPVPDDVEIIDFEELTLAKDPVYENGTLVLYFNETDVWYDDNTEANIGLIAEDEAFTVKADIDFESYPDMKLDDKNHCGIALKPVFEIDPGEYRFSVSFDEYKLDFTFEV